MGLPVPGDSLTLCGHFVDPQLRTALMTHRDFFRYKDGAYSCYCAARDTRLSYRWCLLMQGYFCTVQNYTEKTEPSKCSLYPKGKLGVILHFSEIIKLQFGKERHR